MNITLTKSKKYQTQLMVKDDEDIIGSLKKLPLFFLMSSLKADLKTTTDEVTSSQISLMSQSWDSKPNLDIKRIDTKLNKYGCADRDKPDKFTRPYYIYDKFLPGTMVEYIELVCGIFDVPYILEEFKNNKNEYVLSMDTHDISFCKSYALYHCIRHAAFMPNPNNYFASFFVKINKQKPFKGLNEFLAFFIKVSQILTINSTYSVNGYPGNDYYNMSSLNTTGVGFPYRPKKGRDLDFVFSKLNKLYSGEGSNTSFKYFVYDNFEKLPGKELKDLLFTDAYSFLFDNEDKIHFDKSKIVQDFTENFSNHKNIVKDRFVDFKINVLNSNLAVLDGGSITKFFSIKKSLKNLNQIYELYNRN